MFNDGGEDNTALLESGYVPIEDLNQLNNANNIMRGEQYLVEENFVSILLSIPKMSCL